MTDIVERLRDSISGPHKNGRPLTVSYSTKAETLLEAAAEIERLTAALRSVQKAMNTQGNGGQPGWMMDVEKALGERHDGLG